MKLPLCCVQVHNIETLPKDVLIEQLLHLQEKCEIINGNLVFYKLGIKIDAFVFSKEENIDYGGYPTKILSRLEKLRKALVEKQTKDYQFCRWYVKAEDGVLRLESRDGESCKYILPQHLHIVFKWLEMRLVDVNSLHNFSAK